MKRVYDRKKEEKISNYNLKKTYDSKGKKCLILESKNKTTIVARPIACAVRWHETDIWPF